MGGQMAACYAVPSPFESRNRAFLDRTSLAIVPDLARWLDASSGGRITAPIRCVAWHGRRTPVAHRISAQGLSVLLSLLLGFSLPMALSHYEQRRQLVTDEANAIATVEQRAQPLPEPFRSNILQLVREYVDARIDFAKGALSGHTVLAAIDHAKHLQNEMLQQTVMLVQQKPNAVTPIFAQALGEQGKR
jgi:hypothetical protein